MSGKARPSRFSVVPGSSSRAIPVAHAGSIRLAIQLGDAIGKVVDGLLLGLLHKPGLQMWQQTDIVALERALARGQREATARRRMAADRGRETVS
jgi:hypothetical protein